MNGPSPAALTAAVEPLLLTPREAPADRADDQHSAAEQQDDAGRVAGEREARDVRAGRVRRAALVRDVLRARVAGLVAEDAGAFVHGVAGALDARCAGVGERGRRGQREHRHEGEDDYSFHGRTIVLTKERGRGRLSSELTPRTARAQARGSALLRLDAGYAAAVEALDVLG